MIRKIGAAAAGTSPSAADLLPSQRVSPEINLGRCHYGDIGENAVAVAVRPGVAGWIAVCAEHTERAEQDGYQIRPV